MANQVESSVENAMDKNRALTERIALYIPGYRGYRQKNLRRDEDRAVRQLVGKVIDNAKIDVKNAQRATAGDLNAMRDSERLYSKLDRYSIDVKKAVNGYSAWHDSVKILESELDAVIAWDAALIDDVENLKAQTEMMSRNADCGQSIGADLKLVERTVDKMIDDFRQRDNVMKGFVEKNEE